nr:MAG TPA: hypothetical protein [Caudoviricetes sp.]
MAPVPVSLRITPADSRDNRYLCPSTTKICDYESSVSIAVTGVCI